MNTYEFLVRYTYGETEVVSVEAKSVKGALRALKVKAPEYRACQLLCIIDRAPQVALAL